MKLRRRPLFLCAVACLSALACADVSGSSTSVLSIQFDSLAAPSVVVGDTLRDTTGAVIVPVVRAFNFNGDEITPVTVRFQSPDSGLVVDSILDIVSEAPEVQDLGKGPGILGTAILQRRATDLLDVPWLIHEPAAAVR